MQKHLNCLHRRQSIKMAVFNDGETVHETLHIHPSKLECEDCGGYIKDQYFLKAMDKYWHEDCLVCDLCQCRLGEVGCHVLFKLGRKLCKRDYLRLFGPTGVCNACQHTIAAYEMAMKITTHIQYHLECFKCAECGKNFCVGDKFYNFKSNIFCESDYIAAMSKLSAEHNDVTLTST